MITDELKITLVSGKGGDGVVRWLHIKGKEYSGPAGGDGGRGGDVIARGTKDLTALNNYMQGHTYKAENGQDGQSKNQEGYNGAPYYFVVPVGSIITNTETGSRVEILTDGQEAILLKGGNGGKGNTRFKSSTNTTPTESTPGKPGERASFHVELRFIAEAGFIGLPSAGKSSLVNALTGSQAKVAAYHFTTLEPHLGVLYGHILADIPGLIENAHKGKGLGDKFLRHIARTKMLVHCISLESDDIRRDYDIIRSELTNHDEALAAKNELIVLTKTDVTDEEGIAAAENELRKHVGEAEILTVSIYDDESLKLLSDTLTSHLDAID